MTVKVTGLDSLLGDFNQLIRGLDGEIVQEAGQEWLDQTVVPAAQSTVSVETGELRDSIKGEANGNTLHLKAEAEHASWVEQGTIRTPARPFAEPAVQNNLDKLQNKVDEKIRRIVR